MGRILGGGAGCGGWALSIASNSWGLGPDDGGSAANAPVETPRSDKRSNADRRCLCMLVSILRLRITRTRFPRRQLAVRPHGVSMTLSEKAALPNAEWLQHLVKMNAD